jgi:hypothetical protein
MRPRAAISHGAFSGLWFWGEDARSIDAEDSAYETAMCNFVVLTCYTRNWRFRCVLPGRLRSEAQSNKRLVQRSGPKLID